MTRHADSRSRSHRIRGGIALLLVVFAVLFSTVTVLAAWSHSFLLNTDRYVKTIAPILKDADVTRAVGTIVAKETVKAADLEERLARVGQTTRGAVATPSVDKIRADLARSTTDLLRTQEAYDAWEWTLRSSHGQIISLLRNRKGTVEVEGEDVIVDLSPFMIAGVKEVDTMVPGAIPGADKLPAVASRLPIEEQRQKLATVLGRRASDRFGTVTLFKAEDIAPFRQAVRWFDIMVWVLVGISAALAIAAVLVSPRRGRTLIHLGIGVVIVVIASVIGIDQLRDMAADHATGDARPIVVAAVDNVVGSLRSTVVWLLIAGAIVAFGTYLVTRPRWLRGGGAGDADATGPARPAGPTIAWLRRYSDAIRWIVAGAVILLVVFAPLALGPSLALIAVAAALIIGVSIAGHRPRADGGAARA